MGFGDLYSQYYDTFYQAKDYKAEVRFVLSRLANAFGEERSLSVLDLGCGTGRHAFELARLGHGVHGIDRSAEMLELAVKRLARSDPTRFAQTSFQVGDIRTAQVAQRFDAVICLFHVMSYLPSREDILSAFANVRRHSKPDSLYIFDFWNGPAVFADPPSNREMTIDTPDAEVHRASTPVWDQHNALVHVDYTITTRSKACGAVRVDKERHTLRYFFPDQIDTWLKESGFEVLEIGEWMTGLPASEKCFSAYALARPRDVSASSI